MKTPRHRGTVLLVAVVAALLTTSHQTKAINPVHWSFVNLTTSPLPSDNPNDLLWNSPTSIDTGWAQYNYSYAITKLEIYVYFFGWGWLDVTGEIPPEDRSGSGIQMGSPPWVLADQLFEYPESSGSAVSARVNITVDGGGQGHLSVTDIYLGSYLGLDIGGVRVNGDIDITGVPEPMTLLLLSGGASLLAIRRRLV